MKLYDKPDYIRVIVQYYDSHSKPKHFKQLKVYDATPDEVYRVIEQALKAASEAEVKTI